MRDLFACPFAVVALAATAMPLLAQVPDRHLVVATVATAAQPGQPGVWFVHPATGAVTPVQGLPCELRGVCGGSAGSSFVLRDARSERLLVGNSVANGGVIGAWLLTLQGDTVVGSVACALGAVAQGSGGVHAAAFLSNGDVLLGVGGLSGGALAGTPIVRWTPATGALVAGPLPASYSQGGTVCTALCLGHDQATLYAALTKWSPSGGVCEVLELAPDGSVTVIPHALAVGHHVTSLLGGSSGQWLIGSVAGQPPGSPGSIIGWSRSSWQGWTAGWAPTVTGVNAVRGIDVAYDDGSTYFAARIGANSGVHRIGAPLTQSLVTNGPASGWGDVMSLDFKNNPEVVEAPSGAAWNQPDWMGAGSTPSVGNAQFALWLLAYGTPVVLLDAARTPGAPLLGAQVYLTPGAAAAVWVPQPEPCSGLPGGPVESQFLLPIPPVPSLRGTQWFAQGFAYGWGGLGASALLQFRIE